MSVLTNETILKIKILQASNSKEWNIAVKEWEILRVYFSDDPQKCLCGHYPIKRICELVNKITGSIEKVGSCCVTKFLPIKPELLMNSIKRIKENNLATLKPEIIDLAYQLEVISAVEHNFYQKQKRRSNLNALGKNLAREINLKILDYFDREY